MPKMIEKYVKTLGKHFIVWFLAFIFWAIMREFDNDIVRPEGPETLSILQRLRFHFSLGVVASLAFGSLEYLIDRYVYKRTSFGRALLIGSFAYLLAIILLVTFGFTAFVRISDMNMDWGLYRDYVFSGEMVLLIFYCFLVGTLIDTFKEIDKKFGPGNLWKMIKGEFYNPKEENRIFMFLDLKNSTGIAEALGHKRYSRLIQSCFHDVSELIPRFKASIYQYVGDEIVLSWHVEDGLKELNCLHFYFAYRDKLISKTAYYQKNFGLVPEFKAGLEMGPVMVAEVGDIKREIAYHGDVLNTAARIQGCCNTYGKQLLISENLEQSLKDLLSNSPELLGDLQLNGKQKSIHVYAVDDL